MSMNTDYTRGAYRFTAMTEDGPVTCDVFDRRDMPALGGEFIIYTLGEINDEGTEEVYAAKAVGNAGEMTDVAGRTEWMVIDQMLMEAWDRGMNVHLQTQDLDYFEVRANRYGYETAEQWLIAAIFGENGEQEDDGEGPEG